MTYFITIIHILILSLGRVQAQEGFNFGDGSTFPDLFNQDFNPFEQGNPVEEILNNSNFGNGLGSESLTQDRKSESTRTAEPETLPRESGEEPRQSNNLPTPQEQTPPPPPNNQDAQIEDLQPPLPAPIQIQQQQQRNVGQVPPQQSSSERPPSGSTVGRSSVMEEPAEEGSQEMTGEVLEERRVTRVSTVVVDEEGNRSTVFVEEKLRPRTSISGTVTSIVYETVPLDDGDLSTASTLSSNKLFHPVFILFLTAVTSLYYL